MGLAAASPRLQAQRQPSVAQLTRGGDARLPLVLRPQRPAAEAVASSSRAWRPAAARYERPRRLRGTSRRASRPKGHCSTGRASTSTSASASSAAASEAPDRRRAPDRGDRRPEPRTTTTRPRRWRSSVSTSRPIRIWRSICSLRSTPAAATHEAALTYLTRAIDVSPDVRAQARHDRGLRGSPRLGRVSGAARGARCRRRAVTRATASRPAHEIAAAQPISDNRSLDERSPRRHPRRRQGHAHEVRPAQGAAPAGRPAAHRARAADGADTRGGDDNDPGRRPRRRRGADGARRRTPDLAVCRAVAAARHRSRAAPGRAGAAGQDRHGAAALRATCRCCKPTTLRASARNTIAARARLRPC